MCTNETGHEGGGSRGRHAASDGDRRETENAAIDKALTRVVVDAEVRKCVRAV